MLWRPTTFSSFVGSSHLHVQLGVLCYCCWYLCLLSVYPLAATPLFPLVSFLGARFCLVLWSICYEIEQLHLPIYRFAERRRQVFAPQCTIGTSPLFDSRDGFQMRALSFSHHRVSPDLSAMASPTLAVDPQDTARRKSRRATYGLYGVAANGLTMCICCMIVTCL